MDSKRKQAILNNCDERWFKQFQQDTTVRRVWAKLEPELIINLLEESASAAHFAARGVLARMETHKDKWQVRATAHEGGTGDARGVDESLHITLKAGGITFHLRLKEKQNQKNRLHITQITQ